MAKPILTSQDTDFPQWYQDVVAKAELAENGPARGTIVIRPYGYRIWELLQQILDERIKATGHENAYFPLFIPMSFLEREADHVEGFSPELAVVTHGGGKELGEPLVVRPTSETVINHTFSRWIQSHRDLPVLINQWANVVRWELRPRLFLRTTEFLWQEGHTAHATSEEAQEETLKMLGVYRDVVRESLAIAALTGEKSPAERFAGADRTFTVEGMMRDGKALQMGTSHDLGQNFAKAFDIVFAAEDGSEHHVWQTSWGVSTRLVGAVIMAHGDDFGLRLPPAIAPYQVVVMPLGGDDAQSTVEAAMQLVRDLEAAGHRVKLDDRLHVGFGRRAVDWELKGVPVRVEIGPRDLESGTAVVVRRDTREKASVELERLIQTIGERLVEIQQALLDETEAQRLTRTSLISDLDEFKSTIAAEPGLYVAGWCGSASCEEAFGDGTGASIRCIDPFEELPGSEPRCLACDNLASHQAVIAKAY
ncbi:MAG: proline--tRNA ligase [Acidobacteria bacterium]|nr:MAG: proline--tRNA ligase [Acidobacteriota bacterium]